MRFEVFTAINLDSGFLVRTLMMAAARPSETLVTICEITSCHRRVKFDMIYKFHMNNFCLTSVIAFAIVFVEDLRKCYCCWFLIVVQLKKNMLQLRLGSVILVCIIICFLFLWW
jgi:hypothetical protein